MNKKKNILQVFASKSWGGGELFVYDLSKRLLNDGYKVFCVSRQSDVISNKVKELGIGYYQIKLQGILDIISAFQLMKIVKRNDIEIIHVHNFKTCFLALYVKIFNKKDVKLILSRHLIKKAKTNFLYNILYQYVDNIVFVSNIAKQEFLSTNPKIDSNKLLVIYNSIEKKNIEEEELRDIRVEYNIDNATNIILYTGRLDKEKGIEVLIDAVNLIRDRDFILLIAGTGAEDYNIVLRNKIKTLGLEDKIYLIGFQKEVHSLISACDFGVCPTIARESFGLSIIEFMYNGKAVITTNNGAQKEYISNMETGILIFPNSVKDLSSAIALLLDNSQLRESIGQKAQSYFQSNLSYDKFYQNFIPLYQ